jgi:RecB family exonuclease
MAIQRVFLDWDGPALPRVVKYLAQRFGRPGELDLTGVLLALPGTRAGRRLLELLVAWAEEHGQVLQPPRTITVGGFPELLYRAKKPFADNLVQQLAWITSLKRTGAAECRKLLPSLPAEGDLAAWLALGDMLGRLHRELAADGLNFEAIADCESRFPEFREHERWQCLAMLQRRYLRTLDELDLWDQQTARLFAITHKECRAEQEIVLVGLVDLNRTQRMMLDMVAGKGDWLRRPETVEPVGESTATVPVPFSDSVAAPVTALIFAPEDLADRFDAYGCIRPEAWVGKPLPLASEQIEVVDSPGEQAAAVLRELASWEGRYSAEQITIGMPDKRIMPHVEQHLEQAGLRAQFGVGRPVGRSTVARLLEVVADYLQSPRYSTFAALVRHPTVHDWLAKKQIAGDWLSPMDQYYSQHLPHVLGTQWLGEAEEHKPVADVYREVQKVLEPLQCSRHTDHASMVPGAAPSGTRSVPTTIGETPAPERRPLNQWSQPILDLLDELLGDEALDTAVEPDRSILAACSYVRAALAAYADVPMRLMPSITAADAIRLVLDEIENETIPALPDREAIEMLGWLELPLDDAPALVVTGLNEGIVPSSLNADLFLPNQLRRALGLEDNDRRCARDAYALAMLASSRKKVKVIAGRRSAEGDPLVPSRLLFACDDQTMARRVKAFFGGETLIEAASPGLLQPGKEQSGFEPPRPRPVRPINSMRVTEFRDYLACPYRYYLRHVLRLSGLGDAGEELDGAMFGSLAHTVLDEFGKGPLCGSTSPEKIAEFLDAALDEQVRRQFGESPLPAVRVQVEQLRARLRAFSAWQAGWAVQGWRIEKTEVDVRGETAKIMVDGRPMYLRGRIDRIDLHADGRRTIFDYKSSDTPKKPEQTHRRAGEWIDLQLPLYRHLAAGLGISCTKGPVGLGYIVLPKDTSRVGELLAEWTDDDLRSADCAAEEVVRRVRSQTFWPPASPPPEFSEEFSAICLDAQFGEFMGDDEAEEAA